MAFLRMNVSEWARYHRRLGPRIHEAGRLGAKSAALRVVRLMVKRTREAKPASPGGFRGAVSSGELVRAWKWMGVSAAFGQVGYRVYNDRPYFPVVDGGRRRGAPPPPPGPIRAWLIRRAGMSPEEATAAAWLVARAIGRRGLRPRRILSGKAATDQIEDILEAEIAHEIERAIARPP